MKLKVTIYFFVMSFYCLTADFSKNLLEMGKILALAGIVSLVSRECGRFVLKEEITYLCDAANNLGIELAPDDVNKWYRYELALIYGVLFAIPVVGVAAWFRFERVRVYDLLLPATFCIVSNIVSSFLLKRQFSDSFKGREIENTEEHRLKEKKFGSYIAQPLFVLNCIHTAGLAAYAYSKWKS